MGTSNRSLTGFINILRFGLERIARKNLIFGGKFQERLDLVLKLVFNGRSKGSMLSDESKFARLGTVFVAFLHFSLLILIFISTILITNKKGIYKLLSQFIWDI